MAWTRGRKGKRESESERRRRDIKKNIPKKEKRRRWREEESVGECEVKNRGNGVKGSLNRT